MKIVIASKSPVKEAAVHNGVKALFPKQECIFECVNANSGVSAQPQNYDEMIAGAIGRIGHSKELIPDADIWIALEGGIEKIDGNFYCSGWVIAENKTGDRCGRGRTFSFVIPQKVVDLMIEEGLEQSHATDKAFQITGTKTGNGLIGPLTNNALTYTDWYTPAVISALLPFLNKELY